MYVDSLKQHRFIDNTQYWGMRRNGILASLTVSANIMYCTQEYSV